MTCEKCSHIQDRRDIPHSVRKCAACGRTMYVHEVGDGGRGVKIREGDSFVIPAGFLKFSLNPLRAQGKFFKSGLQWFAELIFLDSLPQKKDTFQEEIDRLQEDCDSELKKSSLLKGLDLEREEDADQIIEILKANRQTSEWWAFLSGVFMSSVKTAIEKNDALLAAWAMACAERCRSMLVFKGQLEEVVWMGQSARRLVDLLRTWETNRQNGDEAFWQQTFTESSFALSQVFSFPVVFVKDQAYVGGMNIDRKGGKFLDYLLSKEMSHEAVLIEIKTPTTRLLGQKYRGLYRPSADLAGSIVQILDYRNQLASSYQEIAKDTSHDIAFFQPKCVLIIGRHANELTDETRRKSFELYRTQFKDVEIVTYDELFRKMEVLATLFNIVKQSEGDRNAK